MINQPRGGGRSMFKFFLLSIFAFLLFAPKSHALIDYTVLDSKTSGLRQVFDSNWTYNDTTNALTFGTPLYEVDTSISHDFRLYVCPDKDVVSYTSDDCSVYDELNVSVSLFDGFTSIFLNNGEIDPDNRSYLVVLMEDKSSSSTPANFEFYAERVIDTTVSPAQFSHPPEVNVAPVGTSFSRTVSEGGLFGISFLNDNSIKGDTDSAKIVTDANLTDISFTGQAVTAPSHGTVEYLAHPQADGGGLRYRHDGSQTSTTDTFTFTVTDDEGAVSNVITASITITPTNSAPVGKSFSRTIDNAGFVNVYFSDKSLEGDSSSAKIVTDPDADDIAFTFILPTSSQPSNGTAEYIAPTTAHPSGGVKYTHDGSLTLSDTFSFRVEDDENARSNAIRANITINAPANTVIFADSPIDIREGEIFSFNPIASDTDNLVDRLEYSTEISPIAPFSLFDIKGGRVVVSPILDTSNEYIFPSVAGGIQPIIPYNLYKTYTSPRTTIEGGSFTITAFDSSNAVIGTKDYTLRVTIINRETDITSESEIILDQEAGTEVDFNIEFTNEDGDDIPSDQILIENKPSWLTVDKTRATPTATTGTIGFTGTLPATFSNVDMTVSVLDPSKSADNDYDVKVFTIKKSGTIDFDDDGKTDTIDANFLYTYILSKENDSLSTLLTSLVKGGEGSTTDINEAITRTEDQLGPLGTLDFDNNGESDTIDANFLYTFILSKENDSLSTLLTSLVKGGIGTTEDINAAKAKVDALFIE